MRSRNATTMLAGRRMGMFQCRVQGGRVMGVSIEQAGERVEERAPVVISAFGVGNNVQRLVDDVAEAWQRTLQALSPGVAYWRCMSGSKATSPPVQVRPTTGSTTAPTAATCGATRPTAIRPTCS
jgi:hypothetical protein